MLQLWLGRRWALASLYTAAFAVAGLVWIVWWQWVLRHEGLQGMGATASGVAPFARQVIELVRAFDWSGLDLMAKNVTRFLSWQNPIALALACLGLASLRKLPAPRLHNPLVALAAGLGLTLVAMFILLPNQGFGWGYRYLHGLLGSFALLAAFGWVQITGQAAARPAARAIVSLASLFTLAVVIPLRGAEIESFVAPYAEAERAIQSAQSDLVLVDTSGSAYATALVRNDPFLRNRPLVLDLSRLTPAQFGVLCRSHSASLFDLQDAERYGLLRTADALPEPAALAARTICTAPHVGAAP